MGRESGKVGVWEYKLWLLCNAGVPPMQEDKASCLGQSRTQLQARKLKHVARL